MPREDLPKIHKHTTGAPFTHTTTEAPRCLNLREAIEEAPSDQ